MKHITIPLLFAALFVCACHDNTQEGAQESNLQTEMQDSIGADISTSKITQDMAFNGVDNYCHKEYDWSIAEEHPDIMFVEMGQESEKDYQVIFRSYTGALVHFFVDKETGKTRVVELIPAMNIKEEKGTIDIHDYLEKKNAGDTTPPAQELSVFKGSLAGDFVSDYDGSSLTITAREDGKYNVIINLFRLTSLDDGVGVDAENGIDFTATDAAGEPIGGRITFANDIATLTFVHSTWSLIENGSTWEFKRK